MDWIGPKTLSAGVGSWSLAAADDKARSEEMTPLRKALGEFLAAATDASTAYHLDDGFTNDFEFLSTVATDVIEFDRGLSKDDREYWESKKGKFDEAGDPVAPILDALSRDKKAAQLVADETGDERVKKLLQN